MKRILFAVTGFLLLIVAAAWACWAYRQYRSYQTPIPAEASSIVRISVDVLLADLAWNALWNSAYYRENQSDKPVGFNRGSWSHTGIAIPANIFLYQLNRSSQDATAQVYFGSVPLTDSSEFSRWLGGQSSLRVQQDSLGRFVHSEHLLAEYDANRVFFAVSPKKIASALPGIRKSMHALVTSNTWSTVSEGRFHGIRKSSGHVVVISEYPTTIEFKSGRILFSVVHALGNPSTAEASKPQFPESNTASLWIAGMPYFLANKTFEIGSYTLHGDSLLKYDKGNLIMEWKSSVTRQDTIISYDYDENFNMLERKEVVEKTAPEIYLSIAAKEGLFNYLQAQRILDPQGLNKEVMPLYRVGVSPISGGFLQLHTADHYSDIPEQHSATSDALYLRVNFGSMDTTSISSGFTPYLRHFECLEASGRRIDGGKVATKGTLRMRNVRINSLTQLVSALQSAR